MSELRSEYHDNACADADVCDTRHGLNSLDPREGFLSGCRCAPPRERPLALRSRSPLPQARTKKHAN